MEAVCDRACSVSMLTPKPNHVIIDIGPEECPRSILKDRVSLNSDLSVCSNEYRTPPPRINMVAHPQPDSQQDGDVPNDRMFTPLSQKLVYSKHCSRSTGRLQPSTRGATDSAKI
ncbi:Hypothetical predicted protein [Mytilus galloprovincialis]|uniref:Uncharacterized protein n=1 Tax=Mytilus galloprovincialis TaxID=29158 RepID=A0A8B6F6T8_MYTGA|nr:Hypothetical predicted protein [Mytilus galloprovincialis]